MVGNGLNLLALARRWSGVDRAQRYRRRNGGAGGRPDAAEALNTSKTLLAPARRWSGVDRAQRYRGRWGSEGDKLDAALTLKLC